VTVNTTANERLHVAAASKRASDSENVGVIAARKCDGTGTSFDNGDSTVTHVTVSLISVQRNSRNARYLRTLLTQLDASDATAKTQGWKHMSILALRPLHGNSSIITNHGPRL